MPAEPASAAEVSPSSIKLQSSLSAFLPEDLHKVTLESVFSIDFTSHLIPSFSFSAFGGVYSAVKLLPR